MRIEKCNKYRNNKVTYDGIIFDSKKEAKRYAELKMLEREVYYEHMGQL